MRLPPLTAEPVAFVQARHQCNPQPRQLQVVVPVAAVSFTPNGSLCPSNSGSQAHLRLPHRPPPCSIRGQSSSNSGGQSSNNRGQSSNSSDMPPQPRGQLGPHPRIPTCTVDPASMPSQTTSNSSRPALHGTQCQALDSTSRSHPQAPCLGLAALAPCRRLLQVATMRRWVPQGSRARWGRQ